LYANTWAHNNTNPYTFGDINVGSLGTITLVSYDSGNSSYIDDYGLALSAENITVVSGGKITATGKGYYGSERGPGAGTYGWNGAGGGGFGGYGGNGVAGQGVGGNFYGDVYEPVLLGSSGGFGGRDGVGGNGGGAIKLTINSQLLLNGEISSNGGGGTGDAYGGGGSGGSIWLDTATLAGSGFIKSDGARAADSCSGDG